MKKLLLLLTLSFFSIQGFAAGCPDGSEPVKSLSADGTYFVYNCSEPVSTPEASYPPGAPLIVSDFRDTLDGKGRMRDQIHQGIDIAGNKGQLILAASDGKVLEATVEKCWGPTIAIDHGKGLDGKKIIALYGHLGEMLVTSNEQVTRGQPIGSLGDNQDIFDCIGGLRHLHFQIGRNYRDLNNKWFYWGWAYFLKDGNKGVNPHLYWSDGPNKVTCFKPNTKYKLGSLTYPVPC
jgi:murein DD-endopeptidase MepM/ murein hydrolase activator NlpD